ncbi:MAG: 4Fe-4S binding protein [Marinifilaceae bacterium]|jgi:polyferredoxin|nr:4Fe-4S binding protein [Marinifilaceae bacterium]
MNSKKFLKKTRTIIQYIVLTLIVGFLIADIAGVKKTNFEAYCPMGGIQSIVTLMKDGILACNMTSANIVLGLIFLIVVLLLGKLFCSFLCPLGTISEKLGKIGEKYNLRIEIKGIADKALRLVKYGLLFLTVKITLETGELFCKTYDPFYSTFSLFGHRVNYLYASITIAVLVFGAIFFRLFWCKYICPLGAISNIFRYRFTFIIVLLISGVVYFFESGIDMSIPIGIICLAGYIIEILNIKSKKQVLLKITRHKDKCVDCGLCSRVCPQGIDVADLSVVKHPDCNLCTDCVNSCPKKGALTIHKKLNYAWLPAVVVVVLFFIGLMISANYRIPTVSKQWGEDDAYQSSKTFTLDHINSVTCYSSSMGFVRRMKKVDGVLGVSTYIKNHSADIVYDTTKISETDIRKMFYIRLKQFVKTPKFKQNLSVYKLRILNYITEKDLNLLAEKLSELDVYQLETQFDKSVTLLVFADSNLNKEQLNSAINSLTHRGKPMYQIHDIVKSPRPINGFGLMKRCFKGYRKNFNDAKNAPREKVKMLRLKVDNFPKNESEWHLLANHLMKKHKGAIGIDADPKKFPLVRFIYIDGMVDENQIFDHINQKNLNIEYKSGEKATKPNHYSFSRLN